MKYLVIANQSTNPIPMEHAVSLYKATVAWTEERVKNGKIESNYIYADGGGFSIANVSSQEELFDELLSYPLYPFFSWEVKVLIDWKHGINSVTEFYKKMGAM